MSRRIFSFPSPERFIIGTIGQPGEREFYLQVSAGALVLSLALEKNQASALVERFELMIKEIVKEGKKFGNPPEIHIPDQSPRDNLSLSTPVEAEFAIGVMSISWDKESERIFFDAQAISRIGDQEEEIFQEMIADDSDNAPDILRVTLSLDHAQGFILRSRSVINAGRVPCIFCGLPINPTGHLCPRANGYRR